MGSAIGKAAEGIGGVLGNAFAAPFKTIFGGSCEGVCSGPWDLICFIEHLCVSNLVKLLLILCLCYLTLLFFYLLFKLGICQCIGRSLCKMCWAACETYWRALEYCTCFLWYKLKNTKRVHRHRFQDMERGYTPSSESELSDDDRHLYSTRKRKSVRERRRVRWRSSPYPSSRYGSQSHRSLHHHHQHHRRRHVRLKTSDVLVHVKGGSQRPRSSAQLQLVTLRNPQKDRGTVKRQRLR